MMTAPATTTGTATRELHRLTLHRGLDLFQANLAGQNKSGATIAAYTADVRHFTTWLAQASVFVQTCDQVTKADIAEYLTHLAKQDLSGVTRARKLAAIREYFRFLEDREYIGKSPAAGIATPKKESKGRNWLTPEEYNKLLSLAGGSVRDFAILQVFLQTGVRISELCNLQMKDVDLDAHLLRVRGGKGMVDRDIALEKKGCKAIKNYLTLRTHETAEHLFLNRYGQPISPRGIQKMLAKYLQLAGITKKVSPHSLRHTFGSYKADKVSPYQLMAWLGHKSLNTTQIYVHLTGANDRRLMEQTSL